MKTGGRTIRRLNGELRIGVTFLFLYGLVLLLADPEWAVWAGAMAVGALPSEIPPSLSHTPAELFAGAGTLSTLGLGAFVGLLVMRGENVVHRGLALCWREWNRWCHGSAPWRL